MPEISTLTAPGREAVSPPRTAPGAEGMREAAVAFESIFLAEMLRHSGLGAMPETFNGGAGEKGFSGMLVRAYADEIAATGSTGIAETVYRAMRERAGA